MIEYAAKRNPNRCPSHPGAVIADILEDMAISKTDVAKALGISRQHFYDILNEEKPLSPTIAARVGKAFGGGPASWLRMQAAYDAWHAEREVDVSKVPVLEPA